MKLIPFDIEKAKAGAKVMTREGKPVRILACDIKSVYPVAGIRPNGYDEQLSCWTHTGCFMESGCESRHDLFLAVEPTLRPWKPEEVPVGAVWKNATQRCVILAVNAEGRVLMTDSFKGSVNFYNPIMLQNGQHSLDGGKTWLPCGVEE